MQVLLWLYRFVFGRPMFYGFNWHLYKLALRGIGVLNSEGSEATGETWFFRWLQRECPPGVIVDVGANTGGYAREVLGYFPQAEYLCFEPHPETFKKLKRNLDGHKVQLFNVAVGNTNTTLSLWDFADTAERKASQPTSTLSSLHQEVITGLHGQPAKEYRVKVATLDSALKKANVPRVDFLKIDTEGNELAVLQGASQTLEQNPNIIVQLEFNEMNAYSRSFLKDMMELLPNHQWFRLMPYGLYPLGEYRPLSHEIFGFQNVVALPEKVARRV